MQSVFGPITNANCEEKNQKNLIQVVDRILFWGIVVIDIIVQVVR